MARQPSTDRPSGERRQDPLERLAAVLHEAADVVNPPGAHGVPPWLRAADVSDRALVRDLADDLRRGLDLLDRRLGLPRR